jgi:histidinol-phosphate/aromatic aminotransferase/cobyric acid decarboxylase-like protein
MAAVENLPSDHIMASAGSSDPLHRSVLAFTSANRPLVTADPGYEAPMRAARFMGAKTIAVPLRKDHSHDSQAMTRAASDAGAIYICNPNNPTGTMTRQEDIEYIVANKPRDCVVIVDEAYIHFAPAGTSAVALVAAGKDVIILRSFSKLYGLAGIRAGAALARPDLLEKLQGYSGPALLPATGMAAATASLKEKSLVPERRKIIAEIRDDLCDWLTRKRYPFIPSEANMVMVDSGRPGHQFAEAMLTHKVAIGRTWPALPRHVRVTIGTREEMTKFKDAFERVMNS